eukprot:scaffold20265_cov41-Attheya_sp.AAC.1
MYVQFENRVDYDIWHQCIVTLKEEASRIITADPDREDILVAGAEAICNWIAHVLDVMVEACAPVIPSVLKTRNNFDQLIRD